MEGLKWLDELVETLKEGEAGKIGTRVRNLEKWVKLREPGMEYLSDRVRKQGEEQEDMDDRIQRLEEENGAMLDKIGKLEEREEKYEGWLSESEFTKEDLGRSIESIEDIKRNTKEGKLAFSLLVMISTTDEYSQFAPSEIIEKAMKLYAYIKK